MVIRYQPLIDPVEQKILAMKEHGVNEHKAVQRQPFNWFDNLNSERDEQLSHFSLTVNDKDRFGILKLHHVFNTHEDLRR